MHVSIYLSTIIVSIFLSFIFQVNWLSVQETKSRLLKFKAVLQDIAAHKRYIEAGNDDDDDDDDGQWIDRTLNVFSVNA